MKKSLLALGIVATLMSSVAMSHESGSWIVRAGGVYVIPNSTSHTNTSYANVKLEVKNNQQLGLTGTYMLTDNLGIELLAATPFSHSIDAIANNAVVIPNAVKVKHLPPSLYAQYYFMDKDSPARPYVGVGLNYTRFFNAESQTPLVTNLDVRKHSVGPVVNAGLDIKLTDNLYFNTALWYTNIRTKARFQTALTGNNVNEVAIKLNPIVVFAGLGYSF